MITVSLTLVVTSVLVLIPLRVSQRFHSVSVPTIVTKVSPFRRYEYLLVRYWTKTDIQSGTSMSPHPNQLLLSTPLQCCFLMKYIRYVDMTMIYTFSLYTLGNTCLNIDRFPFVQRS